MNTAATIRFPGVPAAMDGNSAVIACERESSDAAGAFPITPSTQMGEHWAEAAAAGHLNIAGRPLIFIEPEGEHAAAAVTAGLSMGGLRAANFSSGQGIAYMHESLYAAVGKRLTYVLNMGCRAMTKATLNVHAGHDDYHCIDDTGFFQLFACNAQRAADLNIIAHRIAELALNPGVVAQDGFLTTHLIESLRVPERELIETFLGRPDDEIDTPTPAQRLLFGPTRRRVPELWSVDEPVMAGIVQNQDSYMQSVAAQRPFFFDHLKAIADEAFADYGALTGRRYARVEGHRVEDAEYLILGQGSLIPTAQAVADYLRAERKLRVGVVDLVMFRPFPEDLIGELLRGRRGVVVMERLDQPLAVDPPIAREVRAVLGKCLENGREAHRGRGLRHQALELPYPELRAYDDPDEVPALYSASYGLGSRDLQPEGIIGAVENMLPDGPRRRRFYVGIEFLRDSPRNPKEELHQQEIEREYPHVRELAVHGSENPGLMPPGCTTVRMHSIGGWGAITTGKNLAATLFELLGLNIKANPKYGSEKKGQPTTFYLAAAPEPIRVNSEYHHVDVVLSPDPNVFGHSNAIAGLRRGGIFVIQSDAATPAEAWQRLPTAARRTIVDDDIRVFYLDAFRIAREEATDPELELRMQGIAFQGAFFAATPLLEEHGLDEARLLDALRGQLERKFGGQGARVVEDNLRVVRRGFDEVKEITDKSMDASGAETPGPAVPVPVRLLPQSSRPVSDVHRFWEQTGSAYARGQGNDNLADPFISLSLMPASSALFRNMTGIRAEHPEWLAENCTACGKCWTVCPDTAIPAVVNGLSEILDAAVARVRRQGHDVKLLPRAVRRLEPGLREALAEAGTATSLKPHLDGAIDELANGQGDWPESAADREALAEELGWLREALGDSDFAVTRPFYTLAERDAPGNGGLLAIAVNPATCKGCGECVAVCDDDALISVPQTPASVAGLERRWDLWRDLPNTAPERIRVDDLERGIGVLDNILLDRDVYLPFTSGDGACLGCSEKTVIHLFTATVQALMQPRVSAQVARLDDLITRLEHHVQLKLVAEIDVDDTDTITRILSEPHDGDLTLRDLAARTEGLKGDLPIDRAWLARVTGVIAALKRLRWQYSEGVTGRGRAAMGILNATGCSSVWGSTYPYNPYPFPWANHLFQDSASMALGVFEAHMARMAQGFKAIRMAELELKDGYRPAEHDEFFQRFAWQSFTPEELALCPPVVVVGGDGAMYDIGFQNLSRALMAGKPLKVVVLDTQVYSNTGGQACTSGFMGQISDMAAFGAATQGKQEVRKELGLVVMAHRTAFVAQSTIAHPSHMIESFIEGLNSPRPAVFNCYTSCQPEHGIGDDKGYDQAKLAVESRAYPLFRFDPDKGDAWWDCLDLSGNPARDDDWAAYTLKTREARGERSLELALTFADFAATETRFRKHFRTIPRDAWNDDQLPLADYLALETAERDGKLPFVWHVDGEGRPARLAVAPTLVASTEDRRRFWRLLVSLATKPSTTGPVPSADEIRREFAARLAGSLLELASGGGTGQGGEAIVGAGSIPDAGAAAAAAPESPPAPGAAEGYQAPWIETDECTSCDECTKLNPGIFAYDERGKAYIKDPHGGPYSDLVKAAERCTAGVIHPGLPAPGEPDAERWIERAKKYN